MTGLLRRIKRSRAADAGETPAEGQAAVAEDARSIAQPPSGGAEDAAATPPAIRADPDVPAGVDPAEAAMQPPSGRRGRLRRRLRYLRRARELMLRDLGGLLYEVHRTGGGHIGAHGTVIGAKVQRLTSLDAEATAIETALAAPRAESVVFQPGVGGTCDFCGELYGSAARFCSNCGSPTGSAVRATPAPIAPAARPVPPMPKPPAAKPEEPQPASEEPVDAIEPQPASEEPAHAIEPQPASDEPAEPIEPQPASEEPTDETAEIVAGDEPAAAAQEGSGPEDGEGAAEDGSESSRNPFERFGNGRAEDQAPPELSPGDPLARKSRS